MIPARWQQISDKLLEAMELDAPRRAAFLDELGSSDPELRREIESLLEANAATQPSVLDFLDLGNRDLAALLGRASMAGRRLGDYRVIDQIGEGGMGAVYRAVRDDDQYHKEVAIKLVRAGQDSAFVVQRFRHERQILASLDHHNIARLLDGGTTEEGVPFFVMELIEGEAIDEYCNRRGLPVTERLELFLQVCSAVQFAHQRLIIHRDIKPGNILVTPEGVPKLLDFGVAKILDNESDGGQTETLTMYRALTPAYASPEQVRGEPITTASDVYSLGVVLYELLTGEHPYRRPNSTSAELARAVCDSEPEKPSTLVRRKQSEQGSQTSENPANRPQSITEPAAKLSKRLDGDLDNIVLMALRKEPQRRYVAVEQFAEDIRRSLNDLPVFARKDTARYRMSKFLARHKAGVAAATVVVLTVIAGFAISVREAKIARQERARAERRFNDVRKLANALIFKVHDAVQDLPGATSARKLVVQQGLEYLDSLSAESADDPGLQKELAAGYEKLGEVQIGGVGGDVGDSAGGIESYRKAVRFREVVSRRFVSDPLLQVDLANSYEKLAYALDRAGQQKEEDEYLGKALQIATPLASAYPNNADVQYSLGTILRQRGDAFWRNEKLEDAVQTYKESAEQFNRAGELNPSDQRARRAVAIADKYIGSVLEEMKKLDDALSYYSQASDIDQQALKQEPEIPLRIRDVTVDLRNVADILVKQEKFQAARQKYTDAMEMDRRVVEKDRNDRDTQGYLAYDLQGIAKALVGIGNGPAALAPLNEALKIHEELAEADPGNTMGQNHLALNYVGLGDAFAETATTAMASHRADALRNSCSAYAHAVSIWNDLEKKGKLYKVFASFRSAAIEKMKNCKPAAPRSPS